MLRVSPGLTLLCQQTNQIHLNDNERVDNLEKQAVESPIFFFGGPLLGIHDPALVPEVLYNEDGTRVAFCADPRPPVARSLVDSVEKNKGSRFTVGDTENDSGELDNIFGNAESFSDTHELISVSISLVQLHENNQSPFLIIFHSKPLQQVSLWPTSRPIESFSYWRMLP